MILIYTVGVGTGGSTSDAAQGLANSIGKMSEPPRRVLLVPSVTASSVENAELIAGEHAACAEVVPAEERFAKPDDFLDCREVFRRVIRRAQEDLSAGERLIVNPTFGTKQMGIGAFLAAADEGVGEVTFVGGPRNEGAVITGEEENLFFNAMRLHRERALRHAESLHKAGAQHAAGLLLEAYEPDAQAVAVRTITRCLAAWQSLHYVVAADLAAGSTDVDAKLKTHLQSIRDAGPVSELKAADMLASARRLQRWGRNTDAVLRYCQTLEMSAKARLLKYPDPQAEGGLQEQFKALRAQGDELGEEWFAKENKKLRQIVTLRNDHLHDGRPVPSSRAQELAALLGPFIKKLLGDVRVEKIERLWPATLMGSG